MEGITYADIVTINFTLSVDPDNELPVGSGVAESTIVISPSCQLVDLGTSDPVYDDFNKQCGRMVIIPFSTESPGL